MILASIIIAICIATSLHVLVMAAVARLVGAKVEEVSLFYGKKILKTKFGDTTFSLGTIPLGGYVKCDEDFQNLHPLKRTLAPLCGCLALLILAMAVFGATEGFQKMARGFYQIASGVFAPRTQGALLVLTLFRFAEASTFLACVALVASKLAAFNLLPIPTLSGGDILLTLTGWIKPLSEKLRERIQIFGFIALLIIMLCWTIAFFYGLKSAIVS
jgi:membrane-associated protease RseP (regulator of RpoE activity)